MSNTTLREQIAARLYSVRGEPVTNLLTGEEIAFQDLLEGGHRRDLYKMADEVIRLMEWARELGFRWCEEEELYPWEKPLTLPPDDWKP